MSSRQLATLRDVVSAVQQINNVLDRITTKDWNFHGRRITNAGASQDLNDYIIKQELIDVTVKLGLLITTLAAKLKGGLLIDGANVTVNGELRILTSDGKPYRLEPAVISDLPATLVKATLL